MKGLLLKDFFILKKYAKTLVFILVFYMIFTIFNSNVSFFTGMTVLFFAITTITTFSYDDLAKWDKYARSLPVTKNEIVMSKYLLGLILSTAGTVIATAFSLLFILIKGGTAVSEQLLISYALFAVAVLFNCIMLPLIFRFGTEKSRILMLVVFFVPTGLIVALSKMHVPMPKQEQLVLLLRLSPVFLVLIFVVSLFVSLRVYRNKS